MSKRTVFTTITPLPAGISRETVLATLWNHDDMIALNPSHEDRHKIKSPPEASPEEYHCQWYQITDKVSYLPAGMVTGKVHFKACFHDLATGLQTHVYAPMGLDIKEKWTVGGNLPHEPVRPGRNWSRRAHLRSLSKGRRGNEMQLPHNALRAQNSQRLPRYPRGTTGR